MNPKGMGPLHGKLAFHRPTRTVGIARSRRFPSLLPGGPGYWGYSLLKANGERTDFHPEDTVRRATRDHALLFHSERVRLGQLRRADLCLI
ncbi:MAG: hypothetical protein J0M24_19035 [Verrucomicrobia bacterium]|nr:hypothetical protein [Verrucomicrobiota bacterium]